MISRLFISDELCSFLKSRAHLLLVLCCALSLNEAQADRTEDYKKALDYDQSPSQGPYFQIKAGSDWPGETSWQEVVASEVATLTHDGVDGLLMQQPLTQNEQFSVFIQGPGSLRWWWRAIGRVSGETCLQATLAPALDTQQNGRLGRLAASVQTSLQLPPGGDSGWQEVVLQVPDGLFALGFAPGSRFQQLSYDPFLPMVLMDQLSFQHQVSSQSLAQALDTPSLGWTSSGESAFLPQDDTTAVGGAMARVYLGHGVSTTAAEIASVMPARSIFRFRYRIDGVFGFSGKELSVMIGQNVLNLPTVDPEQSDRRAFIGKWHEAAIVHSGDTPLPLALTTSDSIYDRIEISLDDLRFTPIPTSIPTLAEVLDTSPDITVTSSVFSEAHALLLEAGEAHDSQDALWLRDHETITLTVPRPSLVTYWVQTANPGNRPFVPQWEQRRTFVNSQTPLPTSTFENVDGRAADATVKVYGLDEVRAFPINALSLAEAGDSPALNWGNPSGQTDWMTLDGPGVGSLADAGEVGEDHDVIQSVGTTAQNIGFHWSGEGRVEASFHAAPSLDEKASYPPPRLLLATRVGYDDPLSPSCYFGTMDLGDESEASWEKAILEAPSGYHSLSLVGNAYPGVIRIDGAHATTARPLSEALDQLRLPWMTHGMAPFGVSAHPSESHDGMDAAASPEMKPGSGTYLASAIRTTSLVKFWAKVAAPDRHEAFMYFSVGSVRNADSSEGITSDSGIPLFQVNNDGKWHQYSAVCRFEESYTLAARPFWYVQNLGSTTLPAGSVLIDQVEIIPVGVARLPLSEASDIAAALDTTTTAFYSNGTNWKLESNAEGEGGDVLKAGLRDQKDEAGYRASLGWEVVGPAIVEFRLKAEQWRSEDSGSLRLLVDRELQLERLPVALNQWQTYRYVIVEAGAHQLSLSCEMDLYNANESAQLLVDALKIQPIPALTQISPWLSPGQWEWTASSHGLWQPYQPSSSTKWLAYEGLFAPSEGAVLSTSVSDSGVLFIEGDGINVIHNGTSYSLEGPLWLKLNDGANSLGIVSRSTTARLKSIRYFAPGGTTAAAVDLPMSSPVILSEPPLDSMTYIAEGEDYLLVRDTLDLQVEGPGELEIVCRNDLAALTCLVDGVAAASRWRKDFGEQEVVGLVLGEGTHSV